MSCTSNKKNGPLMLIGGHFPITTGYHRKQIQERAVRSPGKVRVLPLREADSLNTSPDVDVDEIYPEIGCQTLIDRFLQKKHETSKLDRVTKDALDKYIKRHSLKETLARSTLWIFSLKPSSFLSTDFFLRQETPV